MSRRLLPSLKVAFGQWEVSGTGEKCLIHKYTCDVGSIWLVYDVTSRASFISESVTFRYVEPS